MLSARRDTIFRVRLFPLLTVLAGLFAALYGASPSLSNAQDKQEKTESRGEKVRFTSVDGVELQGIFYQGSKRNNPTILMLHALGEDSRKKAWASLAETLNAAEFSVLTFDFRGHGQSTAIDPTQFWKFGRNASSVKGAPKKETIEFRDMRTDYYPVLVNDIAAAKAFLDNRNDTGVCNTSSFIVLGADTGATLGAIWLNAEWHRYVLTPGKMIGFMVTPPTIAKTPEGKDNIAAIWLSAASKLGSRTISFASLLDTAGRENAMPMFFLYSEDDTAGKNIAKACETKFKGKKKDDKYRFTAAVPVKGGGKLTGAGLLQKTLGTDEEIVGYIKGVAEAKGNEWSEREFRKTEYVWAIPGTRVPVPAKLPNEKLLIYDTYERFTQLR
jgi:alpha-beta hydrolase superfamily lysophospholipase